MPYILPSERQRFDPLINALSAELQKDGCVDGNLNYVISTLTAKAFAANRRYAEANKLMGVLACVAAEFYRRDVAPYEDEKRTQNGDVDRSPATAGTSSGGTS
jgi:hypothetical protein